LLVGTSIGIKHSKCLVFCVFCRPRSDLSCHHFIESPEQSVVQSSLFDLSLLLVEMVAAYSATL